MSLIVLEEGRYVLVLLARHGIMLRAESLPFLPFVHLGQPENDSRPPASSSARRDGMKQNESSSEGGPPSTREIHSTFMFDGRTPGFEAYVGALPRRMLKRVIAGTYGARIEGSTYVKSGLDIKRPINVVNSSASHGHRLTCNITVHVQLD